MPWTSKLMSSRRTLLRSIVSLRRHLAAAPIPLVAAAVLVAILLIAGLRGREVHVFGQQRAVGPRASLASRLIGTDGSQTGIANFRGALTSITEPGSTLFLLQRQTDCSLNFVTVNSTNTLGIPTFSIASNTPHYERTLHQLASLTTTPDVYPLGCDQESSGVSSRPGVYGDVNGGALPVSAQVVSTGSGNSVRTRTYSNGFTTVAQHLESTLPTASAVAISDLNKDGNDDIVVVNAYQATTAFVSVMLGNPDGTYKTPVSYPTAGQKSVAAVIEDVNNDGTLDLIVASDDQHISVLIGKGDGTFNSAQSFSAPLNGSTDPNFTPILSLITADLNNDGNKDIVCGNGLVLLGHGDGTFTQLATVAFPFFQTSTSGQAQGLATGDLNRDGKLDLITTDGLTINTWLGNGDGTFTLGAGYASVNNSGFLTVLDLDGDGNLDIYAGMSLDGIFSGDPSSASSAYVLMGNGDGTFVGANTTAGTYTGNNLGDVNGDGNLDLITAATGSFGTPIASFTVRLGTAKGAFIPTDTPITPPISFVIDSTTLSAGSLNSYAVADMDGDGKADLVFLEDNFTRVYVPNPNFFIYQGPVFFTAHSNGDGTFATPIPHRLPQIAPASGFDITTSVAALQIADVDKDGSNDVILSYNNLAGGPGIGNPYTQGFLVLAGTGSGNFSSTPILTTTYSSTTAPTGAFLPEVLTTADLNNDGKPDLVVNNTTFTIATGTVSQLQIFLGNGDGTFKAPTTLLSANEYGIPAIADFNKDGKLDLAFLAEDSSNQAQINLALGNGDGTFTTFSGLNVTGGDAIRSSSLAAGDFDADGNLDLALLDASSVSGIYYGKGTGSFNFIPNGPSTYPKDLINLYVAGPALALDLNKDGKPDLLVGNTILLNTYGGATTTPTATTTALTVSPNPAVLGTAVTLTATITPASGTTVPTGTVSFFDGTTSLGTATIASNTATLSIATLTVGTHAITAVYAGDPNFTGSTSTAVSLSITSPVTPVATTTTLTASANPVASGASVTFTATTVPTSGTAVPTGLVTFSDGSSALGVISLDANGKATLSTAALGVGTHSITASYAGVAAFSASASTAIAFNVTAAPTPDFIIAISPASATVAHGSNTTATITLTPIAGFKQAATLACSGAPASATCTIAPATLTPDGTNSATATLTLQTTTIAALQSHPNRQAPARTFPKNGPSWPGAPMSVTLCLTFLGSAALYSRRRRTRIRLFTILACAGVLAGLGNLVGCSHSSAPAVSSTPKTYTVTVTATSGAMSRTATESVTIQ